MGLVSEENGLEMACGVERESLRMRNGKDGERCERSGGWQHACTIPMHVEGWTLRL